MKKAVFLGLLPFLLVSCGLEEASSSVSSPPVSSESSSSSSSSVSSAPSSSLSSSSSSSRGKGSDLHNLRVSCAVMNNRHGNDAYDEEGVPGMWYPNVISDGSPAHRYEGDHRGDAARILFYMALRYPELSLVEGTTLTGYEMGNLDSLLRWNEEDPVDEFEMQRNGRIYEHQGNRNPFVDHPELAETFYGEGQA